MHITRQTMFSAIAVLLSITMVCTFVGGVAAQSQDDIQIKITDSANGEDNATVGIEITDSEGIRFGDKAFDEEQYNAVFGDDGTQTQDELSRASNTWFNSDDNTVNGVTISQDELSGIINYWFANS